MMGFKDTVVATPDGRVTSANNARHRHAAAMQAGGNRMNHGPRLIGASWPAGILLATPPGYVMFLIALAYEHDQI